MLLHKLFTEGDSLGLQIARRRSCAYTSGPKTAVVYVFGSPVAGIETPSIRALGKSKDPRSCINEEYSWVAVN